MALLELEHVGKRYKRGSRVALDDVSMEIHASEMVVVWGERQSGRSTLLRIAAGIETPDTGTVRFEGDEITTRDRKKLGQGVGYCRREFRRRRGPTVLDQSDRGAARTQSSAVRGADSRVESSGARTGQTVCRAYGY